MSTALFPSGPLSEEPAVQTDPCARRIHCMGRGSRRANHWTDWWRAANYTLSMQIAGNFRLPLDEWYILESPNLTRTRRVSGLWFDGNRNMVAPCSFDGYAVRAHVDAPEEPIYSVLPKAWHPRVDNPEDIVRMALFDAWIGHEGRRSYYYTPDGDQHLRVVFLADDRGFPTPWEKIRHDRRLFFDEGYHFKELLNLTYRRVGSDAFADLADSSVQAFLEFRFESLESLFDDITLQCFPDDWRESAWSYLRGRDLSSAVSELTKIAVA